MINRDSLLAGCLAYVQAVEPEASDTDHQAHAQMLVDLTAVPGLLTMPGPLLAAIAAGVDADRNDWNAVTRQYH
jgi:hypothetical protein